MTSRLLSIGFRRENRRFLLLLARHDVSWLRILLASRSALSCVIIGIAAGIAQWMGGGAITNSAAGLVLCLVAPLFVRSIGIRSWNRSLGLIVGVSVLCFGSGIYLASNPGLAKVVLVTIIFIGMLFQRQGPSAIGAAFTSILNFYVGFYFHPHGQSIAGMATWFVLSVIVINVVGRIILPLSEHFAYRFAVQVLFQRVLEVIQYVRLSHRKNTAQNTQALLARFHHATCAVRLTTLSLAPDRAHAIIKTMLNLEVEVADCLGHSYKIPFTVLRRVLQSINVLREAEFKIPRLEVRKPFGLDDFAFRKANVWPKNISQRLAWLPATRTAVAAALATFAGQMLSNERWFWAVLSTFVIFLGTQSRGDTLRRMLGRLAGTAIGILVSGGIYYLIGGSGWVLTVLIALAALGWAYFILAHYATGVFFATLLVCLAYGALGLSIEPILALRFQEVLLGCIASLIAVSVVFPMSTCGRVQSCRNAVLAELLAFLHATIEDDLGRPTSDLTTRISQLDALWREYLSALTSKRLFNGLGSEGELMGSELFSGMQLARRLAKSLQEKNVPAIVEYRSALAVFLSRSG